jgi:hypothetical protein
MPKNEWDRGRLRFVRHGICVLLLHAVMVLPAPGALRQSDSESQRLRALLKSQPDQIARLTFEYPDGTRTFGKYTKAGSRYRVEATPPEIGENVVWIIRYGEPAIMLYPKRKQYIEGRSPALALVLVPLVSFDQLAEDNATVLRSLGRQRIAGHLCEKIEITAKGREGVGTIVYSAIALKGQIIMVDYGQWLMSQYAATPKRVWIKALNQKLGPDSFAIPEGFKKIKEK